MKSSSCLPFLLTLTTANAAALLPRSPQGPDSNPGEFIDPALSHSNPQNNNPLPPGPYINGVAPTATTNPVPLSSVAPDSDPGPYPVEKATIAINKPIPTFSLPAGSLVPNFSIPPAHPTPTTSLSPSASASAAADLNAALNALINETTYIANETYPYYYGPYYNNSYYYNGSYHHHHHHYYNSSYWNSTDYLNITESYNATDNVVEVSFGEPNGTTKTEYFNVTEPYGYGYGYGFYNGSHHHNHTGVYNGTGFWTDLIDNATATATAALPAGTGSGSGAGAGAGTNTDTGVQTMPYDLTAKPGFTGPKKGKRGVRDLGSGRWVSGVI